MFHKLFIISILMVFLFLFYSCNQSGQDTKNEIKTKNQSKLANSSDVFLGKRYVYSLGCAWDSQTDVNGFLYFYSQDKFRLKILTAIEKKTNPNDKINYYEADKEEIIEGEYSLLPDNQGLKLKFLNSLIKVKYRSQNKNNKEEKREFIDREVTVKLDSCDSKSTLVFKELLEEIPNEKYYQWVEQNYSGKYISYAEGVKEEITISDEKNKLRMYYQSPSYQKSIELVIKKYEVGTGEVEANFPNDKEKNYSFSLSYNNLSTSTKDNQWQQFFKITKLKSDNPKDLTLKGRDYTKAGFNPNNGKEVYDTIVPFLNNRKAKISKITKSHFIKTYQPTTFENKIKKYCTDIPNAIYNEKCLKLIEKAFLKEDKLVRREGEILIYPLKNQRNYFLRDFMNSGEKGQKLTYQGFFNSNAGKIFITFGSYWEWQNYRLLHQNSGEEILMTYEPYLSPNGKYIIAANNLRLHSLDGTSIQLWEITENGFDLVWEFSSPSYVPLYFVWIGNDKVLFEAVQKFGNDEQKQLMTYGEISFEK